MADRLVELLEHASAESSRKESMKESPPSSRDE